MYICPRMQRRAYTLTEILVVLAIVGVLAGLIFTSFHYVMKWSNGNNVDVQIAQAQVERSQAENLKMIRPAGNGVNGVSVMPALATPAAAKPRTTPKGPPAVVPQEYLVTFRPSVKNPQAEATRLAAQYGGEVITVFTRIMAAAALRIPDQNYQAFRADAAIKTLDPNYRVYLRQQTTPAGVRRVFSYPSVPAHQLVLKRATPPKGDRNMMIVNNNSFGNNMINIAIMDSGVSLTHPDLNVVKHVGFDGNPNGDDEQGHGTHVAGVAAGRDNGFGIVGVYPGAPIWSVRVLDAKGGGSILGFLEGCAYVFDNSNSIRVCNLSFGPPVTVPIFDAFVDACVLKGVVMVGAAGNDAKLASSSSPGSAKYIVNVAALADSDGRPGKLGGATSAGADDTFATFSDYDHAVTVVAPGVDILSCTLGGKYSVSSGTSDSAPSVAGLVALLLDPRTSFGKNNRNLFQLSRPPAAATQMGPYLRSIATEQINGIHGESFTYPLVNFRVQ